MHHVEDEPLRICQSKNYIGKVMFLAAMARPRFDREGKETFSGKIGVFPFITMQLAKRWSRNRAAGTLELKAMTSIKREDIKELLIKKVIPSIVKNGHKRILGKLSLFNKIMQEHTLIREMRNFEQPLFNLVSICV